MAALRIFEVISNKFVVVKMFPFHPLQNNSVLVVAVTASHRPLTVEARVESQVIYGGECGTGTGFLRVLPLCPVRVIPPMIRTH
jgi:hypothetical protein